MKYGKASRGRDDVLLGNLGTIVADQIHSFMATLFPNISGLLQQKNAFCHIFEKVPKWFEKHKGIGFKFPRSQSVRVPDKQDNLFLGHKESAANVLTPRHTFQGFEESMPCWLRADIVA